MAGMRRVEGVPAAPGVVRAGWIHVAPAPPVRGGLVEPEAVPGEVQRLATATEGAAEALEQIARDVDADGHPDEAAIFSAQAAIARDPALATMAGDRIRDHREDAIAAVQAAAESFAEQLRSLGDELLGARAADVLDVADRIARHLAGRSEEPGQTLEEPAIVVADDLPPSVTATLPRERLLGIALEGSSPTAHAAILARAYGIPAVVGARGLLAALTQAGQDAELAIDGGTGESIIEPDEATRVRFDAGADEGRRRRDVDLQEARQPAATLDGTEVRLVANIGTPEEAEPAIALGARGVGLFRTEFLFLERATPPSEHEQADAYRRVVAAFAPDPVTIRLLDVGGDKQIPYLPIEPEANPFLGVRALRLAHTQPDLFVTQLRACYRAAVAGSVKVMAPMVADAGDAALLLALAERAREELLAEGVEIGEVDLGVMLEIPSAVLVGPSYFERISFASLGTNDLLQYALAVDRGNASLERYRDSLHPAVLRLIRLSVEACAAAGIELSVCGEMAGEPEAALALTGLGVRSLSMAASSLPAVRRAIRGCRLEDLESLAAQALEDAAAGEVRARFAALLPGASAAGAAAGGAADPDAADPDAADPQAAAT
jgi:phosphoenolpyruvate-protein phosphotransferase